MVRLWRGPKAAASEAVGSAQSLATGAFGMKVLYDPPLDSVADIVFIHGLTGDRERTWRAKEYTECWPKAILPKLIPEARILTFGYDAYVANWREWHGKVSRNSIRGHAGNLLHAIAAHRDESASERAIIFVCHSLGGLVCKDALVIARERRKENHFQTILHCTRGIVFLGTPHQGSSIAGWAECLARIVGLVKSTNRKALHDLRLGSEELVRVQESFQNLVGSREADGLPPLEVICCYEELPTAGVGQIVTQHSATLAGSSLPIGIRRDHASMTRFASEDDPGYKAVAGVLRRWVTLVAVVTAASAASEYSAFRTASFPPRMTSCPASPASSPRSSAGSTSTDSSSFFRVPSGEDFIVSEKVVKLPFHFLPRASASGSRYFQPRTAELAKVTSTLLPDSPTTAPAGRHRSCVIMGLGGCGKTELAYRFVAEHKARYDAIFFLTADSRNRLSEQYSKLAIRLGLVRESDHAAEDLCRNALHMWLEKPVKGVPNDGEITPKMLTWLLVLDNVERMEDIQDFWPRSETGAILITTRETIFDYRGIPLEIGGSLRLGPLAGPDACLLLRHLIAQDEDEAHMGPEEDEDAAILNLAEQQLGGLPLAIHQIAAVMHRQRLTPSRFIGRYSRSRLYALFSQRPALQDYQHSLATVWALDSLPPGAFAILCRISMLDPVGIDDRLLEPTPAAAVESPAAADDVFVRVAAAADAATYYRYPHDDATYMNEKSILCDSSLVEIDRKDGRVTVHRLVQHVARAHLHGKDPRLAALAFNDSLRRIQELWPFVSRGYVPGTFGDMRRWDKCHLLLPHIIHLVEVHRELQQTTKQGGLAGRDLAELLIEAAGFRMLHELADLAKPLVEAAGFIFEHDPGAWSKEDICQLHWARSSLAMQYRDGKEMMHHATLALELEKERHLDLGHHTASLGSAYINMANAHALNRSWDESIAMLKLSGRIRERLPGFTRDHLFSVQYHMGMVLYHKGEYREAAAIVEEGISDRREAFKDREDTVPVRMGALHYVLGIVQFAMGDFDRSLEHKQRALSLIGGSLGPAQRAALTCMYHVAKHHEMEQDWEQVERYCSKILGYHSYTPQYYPNIARVAFMRSKSCARLGRMAAAEEWRRRAAEMHNHLRPERRREVAELTEEDVSGLVIYDCV